MSGRQRPLHREALGEVSDGLGETSLRLLLASKHDVDIVVRELDGCLSAVTMPGHLG